MSHGGRPPPSAASLHAGAAGTECTPMAQTDIAEKGIDFLEWQLMKQSFSVEVSTKTAYSRRKRAEDRS